MTIREIDITHAKINIGFIFTDVLGNLEKIVLKQQSPLMSVIYQLLILFDSTRKEEMTSNMLDFIR